MSFFGGMPLSILLQKRRIKKFFFCFWYYRLLLFITPSLDRSAVQETSWRCFKVALWLGTSMVLLRATSVQRTDVASIKIVRWRDTCFLNVSSLFNNIGLQKKEKRWLSHCLRIAIDRRKVKCSIGGSRFGLMCALRLPFSWHQCVCFFLFIPEFGIESDSRNLNYASVAGLYGLPLG